MSKYYNTNEAITKREEDKFNYSPYAEKIREAIKNSAKTDEPLIFGIYGKWGEGKSSLMNLIYDGIEVKKLENQKGIIRYKFNPWRYSSEETVLLEFFKSLIKRLEHDYRGEKTTEVINNLKKYTKAILSGITLQASIGKLFKVSYSPKELLKEIDKEKTIEELKSSIDNSLGNFNYRLVIFIDDIDRLKKTEISNLFRLIKLTASFKNLTFVIAFDDDIVAKALYKDFGNSISDGYKYIEKIVNIALPLPRIDSYYIYLQLENKLIQYFKTNEIVFDSEEQNTYHSGTKRFLEEIRGIEKLIKTPREMVRLINNFSTSLIVNKGEVNYADLLWLELLKLKYNDVYKLIKEDYDVFVGGDLFNDSINDYHEALHKFLVSKSFNDSEKREIKHICSVLFPYNVKGAVTAEISHISHKIKTSNLNKIERRITDKDSFDVFFSFNTEGKVSNLLLDNFINHVEENDTENSISSLKDIINEDNKQKWSYYLIDKLNQQDKKVSLFLVLVSSLNVLNSKQIIAKKDFNTNTNKEGFAFGIFLAISRSDFNDEQKKYIENVLRKDYNISEVSHAIHGYNSNDNNKQLLDLLDKVLLEKANEDNIFYTKVYKMYATNITYKLVKNNKKRFLEKFINNITQENLLHFIKIFTNPHNEFIKLSFEGISHVNLQDEIYEKLILFFPTLENNIYDLNDERPKELKNLELMDFAMINKFVSLYKEDMKNPT